MMLRLLLCLLLVSACRPAPAMRPTPVGDVLTRTPVTGAVVSSAPHRYRVELAAGQVLLASFEQHDLDIVVSVFDPEGAKIAAIDDGDALPERLVIEAKRSGWYAIEVSRFALPGAPDGKANGTYVARLDEVITANAYVERQVGDRVASPRVLAVWKELLHGDADAAERFWRELKGHAPILETYPGDPQSALVTFVMRSSQPYVGLMLGPTAHEQAMVRLATSDLWYLTARVPSDAILAYAFAPLPAPRDFTTPWHVSGTPDGRWSRKVLDPNNPSVDLDMSRAVLPAAPPPPVTEAATRGALVPIELASSTMHEGRRVKIYLPPGYDPKATYPLVIAFDGEAYGADPSSPLIPLPQILDHLIETKAIGPIVAALVENQGTRNRDLTANATFATFVTSELVPKVRADYHAGLTPAQTLVTGSSFGGLCAAYVALEHPDVVGNVLAQSAALWFRPGELERDLPLATEPGWLIQRYVAAARQPVRFYLDVGRFEVGAENDILPMNRRFRDVLLAKGYEVHYAELSGGHDYAEWARTIGGGLVALFGSLH